MSRFYRNEFIIENIEPDLLKEEIQKTIPILLLKCIENCDYRKKGGLYTGSVGVAYAAIRVLRSDQIKQNLDDKSLTIIEKYCEDTIAYWDHALSASDRYDKYTLFFGLPGLYWLAILFYSFLNIPNKLVEYQTKMDRFLNEDIKFLNESEMLYGLTGILALIQEMKNFNLLKSRHQYDKIYADICESLLKYGKENGLKYKSKFALPFHGKLYLGAAHGLSSTLQMMIKCQNLSNENILIIQEAVNDILALQTQDGNFPPQTNSSSNDLVHWCHGAPGVIYLMMEAYICWKDQKYLNSCLRCANEVIWERGLLKKGSGLCHGISGNAYSFLLLYKLTNQPIFLQKAFAFAAFMIKSKEFNKESRMRPDNPYSLFEGMAGEVVFYVDLLNPKQCSFPLSGL